MPKRFLEKILMVVAVFVIFAMPLIIFPHRLFPFTTSKNFFFMGFAEILFLLWVYIAAVVPEYRLSKKQLLLFFIPALLLLSLTISGLFAANQNLAFWSSFERGTGLIFLYHCFLFSIVVASLATVHGKKFFQKIEYALFFSGIILALSTFIGPKLINLHSQFFNATSDGGLLGNVAYSGAYLIFSFFLGAVLFFEQKKQWQRMFISVGLLVIFFSPVIIRAHGAAIALVVGIAVAFFIWLAISNKKIVRIIGSSLLALTLLITLFSGISLFNSRSVVHKEFVKITTDSRFRFWKAAIQGIEAKPVFGWGPENYSVVFSRYFDPSVLLPGETGEVWVDKPHNAILEMFVAGGFIGGVFYLSFLTSFFALPVSLYKKKIFSKKELAILLGMFFAYFLQNLIIFDTVSTYVVLFTLFGVFIGSIPLHISSEKIKSTIPGNKKVNSLIVIVCIGVFIPAWIFFVHLPAEKAKAIYTEFNYTAGEKDYIVVTSISPMGNGQDAGYIADLIAQSYESDINNLEKNPEQAQEANQDIISFLDQVDTIQWAARANYRLWLASAELVYEDIQITNTTSIPVIERGIVYAEQAYTLSPTDPRAQFFYSELLAKLPESPK